MIIKPTISNAEYHSDPAVSSSHLHAIAKSPYYYLKRYKDQNRPVPESTPAMQFGSLVHMAVLEPDKLDKNFACCNARKGSTQYNELVEKGIEPVKQAAWDQALDLSDAVRRHPVAKQLLAKGKAEQSVWWTDDATKLTCKCRPDWWTDDDIIVDLKTTKDASAQAFSRSVHTFRYHVQQTHYLRGTKAKRFLFLVVEKEYPYQVVVYELDSNAVAIGEALRERDMKRIQLCKERNHWPGYSNEIEPLSLPKYGDVIDLHSYDL